MNIVTPNNNRPPATPKGKWWWPIFGIKPAPPPPHPLWKVRDESEALWKATEAHTIVARNVEFVAAKEPTRTGFSGTSIEALCASTAAINDAEEFAKECKTLEEGEEFQILTFVGECFFGQNDNIVNKCGLVLFLSDGHILASECAT